MVDGDPAAVTGDRRWTVELELGSGLRRLRVDAEARAPHQLRVDGIRDSEAGKDQAPVRALEALLLQLACELESAGQVSGRRIRQQRIELGHLTMRFRDAAHNLPAKSKIQGESRRDLPVVLNIGADFATVELCVPVVDRAA